ncbi:HET domain-containing protein [Cordyceps militaris CM01]|uniref:HET domain-containing protein n=1 Tax=Cordyceps militaris (strain CM01) TaxID=983644 RepID=G3JA80_CORMM|nr:HET domain-containing protein [Cordyceps militaris CM01]EGX94250.1 HET domain-containing protein [Cordyceps militaris CM01]
MDRDSLDPKVCACCCSLAAEEAEEHARLDQTEMTLSLPRRLRDIRIASRSCVICAVFLEVLSFFGVPCDAYDRTEVTLLLPIGPGNIQIAFRARGARSVAQLYSSAKLRSPWQRVLPLPDVCTHQLSPQGRGFITTCLQTCLQSHPVCRAVTTWNHKVPQRLLYVGRSGDEDVLRLVDTAGTSPGAYTALSYSWGGAVTTKTTRANMAEMKQHIRLADLQDTLVDAVVLTRALGVDYLWVDSLCIVQDSIEDWERESAKMASVYANALITIASVSSTSAAVFARTVQTEPEPALIKARLIGQSGIHWRWQTNPDERAPKEPWAQRGWTLQEQVLSSRLLMLSATEMQWVCKQAETCECLSTLNRRRQFGRTPLAQLDAAAETFSFWHKLVENYSNRALSRSGDRLPAISGIAEVVQQKTRSRYVAGLWEDNIDLDLLWHKTGDLETAGDRHDPRAPSFSWASVDGEVDYYCFRNGQLPYRKLTDVLSVESQPSPHAPLGRVAGGRLTLRGPVIASRITRYSEVGWAAIDVGGRTLELILDSHLEYIMTEKSDDDAERVACRRRREGQAGVEPLALPGQDVRTVRLLSPGIRCWVLVLGEFESEHDRSAELGAELMVLGKSAAQPGWYQRLGMVSDIVRGLNSVFGPETVSTMTLC